MAKLLSGPEWVYTDGWLVATNTVLSIRPMCGHAELRLADGRNVLHQCEGGSPGASRLVELIAFNIDRRSSVVLDIDDLAKIVAIEFGCEASDNQKG